MFYRMMTIKKLRFGDFGVLMERENFKFLLVLLVDDAGQLHLLLILILVAPAPCVVFAMRIVRSITSSLNALLNNLFGHGLEVISPSNLSEEVDEGCGDVHSIVAEFGGLVVPWEDVLEMRVK